MDCQDDIHILKYNINLIDSQMFSLEVEKEMGIFFLRTRA